MKNIATLRKIAILGFGREGQSILRFIKRRPEYSEYKDSEIWISDKKTDIKIPAGLKSQLGKKYLDNLEKFSLIFRSPGIPYNLPALKRARQKGVKFSSLTQLFFENCPAKIIGITGTKGKGTTSTLLYQILKTAKKPAILAGNIGKAVLDFLPKIKNNYLVILELSSFQLQDLKISPQIAAVLDIFPDHQDAHFNLREYYESKANIGHWQKTGDTIFFLKNNAMSRWAASKSPAKKIAVDENKFKLFKACDLKIKGWHNFKNAAMAATIALYLGIPPKIIAKTAKNFKGMEHRLEFVRKIGNISFYNDSAATNPQTAVAAIKSFPNQTKILIAGGKDKGLDYKTLTQTLKNSETKLVVLFGENKKKIWKAVKSAKIPVKFTQNLHEAVKTAYQFAQKKSLTTCYLLPTTYVIIFSPASASFDMFKDYADRGKQFKKMVKGL